MRIATICKCQTVTWVIWTFLHNCGFVEVKRGKKNTGGCSAVNMCSQRLFCTEGTHSPLLAHTSAFPTQRCSLNCCTLILSQQLPAASFNCSFMHRDTRKCFRRVYMKKKKPLRSKWSHSNVLYVGWSHVLCFNICPHSLWSFLPTKQTRVSVRMWVFLICTT